MLAQPRRDLAPPPRGKNPETATVSQWLNHLALHINVHWNVGAYRNATPVQFGLGIDDLVYPVSF